MSSWSASQKASRSLHEHPPEVVPVLAQTAHPNPRRARGMAVGAQQRADYPKLATMTWGYIHTLACEGCSRSFIGKKGSKYCSAECCAASRRKCITYSCANCSTPFAAVRSRRKDDCHVCSKACQNQFMAKKYLEVAQQTKKNIAQNNRRRVEEIRDCYIASSLWGVRVRDVPPAMFELKRMHLKVSRLIKERRYGQATEQR